MSNMSEKPCYNQQQLLVGWCSSSLFYSILVKSILFMYLIKKILKDLLFVNFYQTDLYVKIALDFGFALVKHL